MSEQQSYRRSRQLLTVTIIFFWASEYCHAPYFVPYLKQLGFMPEMIGIIAGTYGFTQLCVRIPLGMLTDATGAYRHTILTGACFTTLSSFGLIFAVTPVPIFICRVLAGLAASTWLAFTVLYNAYYRAEESVQAMTNVNAYNNAGKLIAFALGMLTSQLWGYRIPLVCSFLTGCVAVAFALRLKPIELRREPFRVSHVLTVLRTPAVIVAALFAIMQQFFMQGTVFAFTSQAAENLGASPFMIGLTTVLYTVIQVVSVRPVSKVLLKKLSAAQAVALGCALLTVSAVLVGLGGHIVFVCLGQLIAGIANLILAGVLMAMAVRHVPQEKHSTAMGLYQAIYALGMSAGPVLVGQWVAAFGLRGAYLIVAGIMAVTAVVAPIVIPWADRDRANA